jgi:hypothetical protein
MNDVQLLSQLDRGGRSALMMLSCFRSSIEGVEVHE